MKAIILIELDENHLAKQANDLYDRLKGYKCELMPLPEKKEAYAVSYTDRPVSLSASTHPLYADGWNECLKEITGETDG